MHVVILCSVMFFEILLYLWGVWQKLFLQDYRYIQINGEILFSTLCKVKRKKGRRVGETRKKREEKKIEKRKTERVILFCRYQGFGIRNLLLVYTYYLYVLLND